MSKLKKIQQEELQNVAGGGCKATKKTVTKWRIRCTKCNEIIGENYASEKAAKIATKEKQCRWYHWVEVESYETSA